MLFGFSLLVNRLTFYTFYGRIDLATGCNICEKCLDPTDRLLKLSVEFDPNNCHLFTFLCSHEEIELKLSEISLSVSFSTVFVL